MDLVSSGTIPVAGGDILTNNNTIGAGVFVVELDLSPLVDDSNYANPYVDSKVVSEGYESTLFDLYLRRGQATPRWRSSPMVFPASGNVTFTVGAGSDWPAAIGYKLFKLAGAVSADSGSSSFTTGQSQAVSSAVEGVYVLLMTAQNMTAGDRVKITTMVDSEVVDEYFLANAQYPDRFQSRPIVASSTGCSVTISFEALSGATAFVWNLLRVG